MKCRCGCNEEVMQQSGHRQREFYSDACRKRYGRQSGQIQTIPDKIRDTIPDKSIPDKQSGQTVTRTIDASGPGHRVPLPGDDDYEYGTGKCGHCGVETMSINMTCCLQCSMAGKGRASGETQPIDGRGDWATDHEADKYSYSVMQLHHEASKRV